jgi:hypothetical protein
VTLAAQEFAMTGILKDPLLTASRIVITVVMVVVGLVGMLLVVCAGYIAIDPAGLTVELFKEGLAHPGHDVIVALVAVMLLALIPLAMALLFLQLLRLIVDSVGIGDPFVPENAVRLWRMAWLAVGIQVASIPIGLIGVWLAQHVKDADIDLGVSPQGIVLALVLFVLARVFRQGAAMREELEGTV